MVLWITGLSGAGKSTLAGQIALRMRARGLTPVLLDGDGLREVLGAASASNENHGRAGRLAMASRYARLCRLIAVQNIDVVIATISMFQEVYAWNRANLPDYVEVYLKTPLDELRRRDPKGIYREYDAGFLKHVAGLDLDIDEPSAADWVVEFEPGRSVTTTAVELMAILEKEKQGLWQMTLKAGDYTGLAGNYSVHRPDYCPSVLSALSGLLDKPMAAVDFVDVGAGTGIWTRLVHQRGTKSSTAVEPNDDMRTHGMADSAATAIRWVKGRGEHTGLPAQCCDWLTMASSFHWVGFEPGIQEFHRVLRSGGRFSALWNPRLIEINPLLVDIESHLEVLLPNINRISSGRSGITETLTERLWASPYFDDVVYLEGRHLIEMSPSRYMGAWRSVNDLRVQLGAEKFDSFLAFIERRIAGAGTIAATYLTRAWSARRKD